MVRCLLLTLPLCALISGCQSMKPTSACAGFEKLRPNLETSVTILRSDRLFANQVAAHNRFGSQKGCWE